MCRPISERISCPIPKEAFILKCVSKKGSYKHLHMFKTLDAMVHPIFLFLPILLLIYFEYLLSIVTLSTDLLFQLRENTTNSIICP